MSNGIKWKGISWVKVKGGKNYDELARCQNISKSCSSRESWCKGEERS